MKIIKKTLFCIFCAWLLVLVGGGIIVLISPQKSNLPTAPATKMQPVPIIDNSKLPVYTVDHVARDYIENNLAADKKYNGKRFVVSGNVSMINTDLLGNPFVIIDGASRYSSFQLLFSDLYKERLAGIKANTIIKAACDGSGETLGQLLARNCEILL